MRFPSTFAEAHISLDEVALDDPGAEAVRHLKSVGYAVEAGVCREDVPEITEIAGLKSVREFCPRDLTERYGSMDMMEARLPQKGGRGGMLLLRNLGTGAIDGFGCVGKEKCPELPRCESTFAIRLHERAAGARNGIGRAFTVSIVSGAVALWGARAIGLETWASNEKAVNTYLKAGATLVKARSLDDKGQPIRRPTLDKAIADSDGMRLDTRLFMQFDRTL